MHTHVHKLIYCMHGTGFAVSILYALRSSHCLGYLFLCIHICITDINIIYKPAILTGFFLYYLDSVSQRLGTTDSRIL